MNGRGARAGPRGVEYPGNPGELPGYFLGHEISRGTSVTDFPLRSRMTGTISPISRLYISAVLFTWTVDRPILEKYIVQSPHTTLLRSTDTTQMSNQAMDRSFLTASVEELVSMMSLGEKVSLLAGEDWWR